MTELEEAGIWEKLSSKKISYFESKDLPSDAFGFVYKVLKKWACNKHSNNFIVITKMNWLMFCGQSTIYFTNLNHGRLSKSGEYVKIR